MLKRFCRKMLAIVLAVSMVNVAPTAATVQAEETQTSTVIDVTDYGADPSGKHDSTEAVMAALEEAKTIEGDKTLNFPYGEYRFDKDHASTRIYHTSNTSSRSYPQKKIAILLEEVEDLTIEGNDSTLLVYGDIMALAVVESSNIRMQNFVLDYKDADTIDVSVVKTDVDEKGKPFADIYVPAAYNYVISEDGKHIQWQGEISAETGEPYWTWNDADFCAYLVVYKGYDRTVIRANNKAASNPFTDVTSITPVGESTVRFTYESALPTDIVEGNIYQLSNSAWRQTAGAFFWESEDLTVENIDVHYLSGFGWLTQMCMNVEFKGVDFLPREGSGKYTTSNADQLHVAGCGGYFKVTDCNFSMAHDDPINVHGTYMRVEEVIDARTVRMKYIHGQQGGFRQFHQGDEVLFYSRTFLEEPDGQVETQPFVVESSVGPGEVYTGPATDYNGKKLDLVTEIVTFAEELPETTLADLQKTVVKNSETQPLYVAENVTYTPAVTIKGNRMKSIPTRGILCTTRQEVIIEENIFDNMAMASIYLSNDADDWYESGPIRNLTIRNNTFYIRPTGQAAVGTTSGVFIEPITIASWTLSGGETTPKNPESLVHENITIEGNTFHISNDNVVTANRVDGLTIKNNTIIHDDSSLAITLDTKAALGVGKSQEIGVNVKETTLQKDVFQFNDCHNVVVENNTYDEGMNLNIQLDSKMSREDLTLGVNEEEVLTVANENFVTSASKVQLISTNPEVAYVDETGRLVGVLEGTTTVYAYIEKNGALIRSNEVEVTVGSAQSAELTLEAEKTYFESKEETVTLTTSQADVTYEVLEPLTMKPSDKAVVEEGVYKPKKDGAVVVKASTESATAELLMINSFADSYGTPGGLADGINITNSTNGGTASADEHSIQITPQSNGNGITPGGTKVDNLVNIAIPGELRSDLRLQVTAEGLVAVGSGWNSSGVILYTDIDNYVFVGKRNHQAGVSSIYEKDGQASEYTSDAKANNLRDMTLEFVVDGTSVTVSYQDTDGVWNEVKTFEIGYLQTSDMKLGLASWLNGGDDFTPVYKNIRMAKASETTRDMSKVAPVSLYKSFENARPVAESVNLTATKVNENAVAEVSAGDTDGSVSSVLYQWNLDTEEGMKTTYTSTNQYAPTEEGELTVNVIAFDNYNKPSQMIASNSVDVAASLNNSDELQNLYINGNAVEGFASNVYNYEVFIPADSTKVRISYDDADTGISTVIDGKEETTVPAGTNSAVVEMSDSYTLTRGNVTYTVKVNKVESSDNKLTNIHIGDQEVDLTKEIKTGTDSYFVQVEEDSFPMSITAKEGVSEIKVTRSYFETEVEDKNEADNIFETEVDMKAGINAYYIYVTAADGISMREVKLYLFRDSYTDSDLENISINGTALEEFDASREDYLLRVSAKDAQNLLIEADTKDGQKTSITYKNQRTEGTSSAVTLETGMNEIIITNEAKNIWSKNFYTLNIIAEGEDNAELLSLTTDRPMNSAFDPDSIVYEINDIKGTTAKLEVSAQAQMAEADIRMYLKGSEQSVTQKGEVTHEFLLYEGNNCIVVEVTATDGKTQRTYELNVNAKGLIYASDVIIAGTLDGITNTKAEAGYGSIVVDSNVGGDGKITLADENGGKVVFDKGIGAHASSEVIFTLEEGHKFEYFEAYAGVDYSKYVYDASTVNFEVWVDDEMVYDSMEELGEATRATTPMQFIKVDISDATEVKLITDEVDNNGYDHSEWADACFTRSLEKNPNIVDPGDDDNKPGDDDNKPGDDDNKPGDNDNKPGDDDNKPGDDDNKPGDDDNKPGDDDNKPGDDDNKPGNDDNDPSISDNNPSVSDNEPSVSDNDPTMKDGLCITGVQEEYLFNNAAHKPVVSVYDNGILLTEKKDYTVSYKNNKNIYTIGEEGQGFDEAAAPQIILKFKGNYAETRKVYFKIMPVDISKESMGVVLAEDKLTVPVKGSKQQLPVPELYWNGKKLKMGKDFEIPEYTSKKGEKTFCTTAGDYPITVKGKGNFIGELKAMVHIVESENSIAMSKVKVKVTAAGAINTSGEITEPTYTVKYKNADLEANGDKAEYKVKFIVSKNAQNGYIRLDGTGIDGNGDGYSFVGSKTVSFKISRISMKKVTISMGKEYPYAEGAEVKPDETALVTLKSSVGDMVKGKHYTVTYQKNVNKGTATAIFTGIEEGGYTGVVKKNFKITPVSLEKFKVEFASVSANDKEEVKIPYMKGGSKPKVVVTTDSGKVLVEGTDYTLAYKKNTKVGNVATVTVKGKGNYNKNTTKEFTVVAKPLTNENGITITAKDKVEGKAGTWKQSIKIYDANGKALGKSDYEAGSIKYYLVKEGVSENSISGNQVPEQIIEKELLKEHTVEAGRTILVSVAGKGNYAPVAGEVAMGTYRIIKKGYDIGKAVIPIREKNYTGQEILLKEDDIQNAILKINGKEHNLFLGQQIEIVEGSYQKNINKGKAKVTFRGIGEFGGTKTVTFKIVSKDTGESKWQVLYELMEKLFSQV